MKAYISEGGAVGDEYVDRLGTYARLGEQVIDGRKDDLLRFVAAFT